METHQSLEEVDLVRGLQERDPKAMEVFLERYSPLLHHCISQFAGRDLERDDLWQELLKYSLERLDVGHFDPQRGALGTWLYRVAWCRCLDLQRRLQSRQAPGSRLPQEAIMEQDADVSVCGTQVEAFPNADVAEGFRIYVQWQNALVTHDDICREIFIESPIAHPSSMLRRLELVEMGAYQERGWAEDYDLWLRYHAAGRRFAKVAEPLVRWREHRARATRTDSRYSIENFLRAKAHYLSSGPLAARDGLIVWGAGQTGRRLSKHLIRAGHRPDAFVDILRARGDECVVRPDLDTDNLPDSVEDADVLVVDAPLVEVDSSLPTEEQLFNLEE